MANQETYPPLPNKFKKNIKLEQFDFINITPNAILSKDKCISKEEANSAFKSFEAQMHKSKFCVNLNAMLAKPHNLHIFVQKKTMQAVAFLYGYMQNDEFHISIFDTFVRNKNYGQKMLEFIKQWDLKVVADHVLSESIGYWENMQHKNLIKNYVE